MSNSYNPLAPVQVTDPLTEISAVNSYAVLSGGDSISFKNYPANSVAASVINFNNANPPAGSFITDRSVDFSCPVRLTINGNLTTTNSSFAPSSTLLNLGKDAPRSFPLASSIQTVTAQINNETVTIPSSDVFQQLSRYNISTDLKVRDYSGTPTYPDMCFNYNDLTGTNNNCLAQYANSPNGSVIPRGAWPFTFVSNPAVTPTTSGAAVTAVVDFFVTEPIFLSPFYFGAIAQDAVGFYNVQTISLAMNFLAQAGARLWSHADVVATSGAIVVKSNITSIVVQFNNFTSPAFSFANIVNQPNLGFKYIAPNLLTKERLGPLQGVTYPYWKIDEYITDLMNPIAYGVGPTPYNTNTVQLSTIPRYLYIDARPSQSALLSSPTFTDTSLVISGVSVQFQNNPSLMASCSQYQLWKINAKNSGSQDYISWIGQSQCNTLNAVKTGIGSVLCLEFGTDLQMSEPTQAPGVAGNFALQVTVILSNMNSSLSWDTVPISIRLITMTLGTFSVPALGQANVQQSVLTVEDVIAAQQRPAVSYHSIKTPYGGDFFSSLSNFANNVNNFLKEHKVVSSVASLIPHPAAQAVSGISKSLGYGGKFVSRAELDSMRR